MWEAFEKLPTPFSTMGYYNYANSQDTTLRLPCYSNMIGYCRIYADRQLLIFDVMYLGLVHKSYV